MSDTGPTGDDRQPVNGWGELGKLGLTLAALGAALALTCRPAPIERALPAPPPPQAVKALPSPSTVGTGFKPAPTEGAPSRP